MFGVAINEPADVFCDNQSVDTNVSIPSSVLNKKHNFICYHRFWEAHTAGTIWVGWISGEYNKSDVGKETTVPTKRQYELLNSIFNEKVSTITKKYNYICYRGFCEEHTANTIWVGWISGEYNKSDIGTNTTIPKKRRYELLNLIFNEKVSTITN